MIEELQIKNDNLTKINVELTKQLEKLQIKNDNLTKINVELTKQLEELTKSNVDLTKQLANFTKIDNKPTINWTKNKLTFIKKIICQVIQILIKLSY